MGFVGKVMDGVNGIEIYYIIGIAIFILLFFVVLIRTIKTPKASILAYKNSIFDGDEDGVKTE